MVTRRPDGSVGMALVLPALTDFRWWFESLLGVSSATRRKATGADHKKASKVVTRRKPIGAVHKKGVKRPGESHEGLGQKKKHLVVAIMLICVSWTTFASLAARGLNCNSKAAGCKEEDQTTTKRTGCSFFPLQTCIFSASQLFLPQTRVFFTSCIFFRIVADFFHLKFFHVSKKNVSVFQNLSFRTDQDDV